MVIPAGENRVLGYYGWTIEDAAVAINGCTLIQGDAKLKIGGGIWVLLYLIAIYFKILDDLAVWRFVENIVCM